MFSFYFLDLLPQEGIGGNACLLFWWLMVHFFPIYLPGLLSEQPLRGLRAVSSISRVENAGNALFHSLYFHCFLSERECH